MFLRKSLNYFLAVFYLTGITLVSFDCYANKEPSVNVISWWGYLNSPSIAREVKQQCGVNLSFDTYYTNDEFLRRVATNKERYDIIIFSNTIYKLIKNQIPESHVNLSVFSKDFNPTIKNEYLRRHYPNNVIFFMHSLSGFLWNPKVIELKKEDEIKTIYKKANDNIVVMINDPLEIWNLIKKSYDHHNNAQLNLNNFKNLIQQANVYLANNYNQMYDKDNFAFAFGWSGDAIVYMKQAKKNYQFLIHPKLSYISTDLMAAMNEKQTTMCVSRVLMSKKVLDIVQNYTYYVSPYGNYKTVKLPLYQSIYKEMLDKLPNMSWIESSDTMVDYEKMIEAWNEIQLNTRGN